MVARRIPFVFVKLMCFRVLFSCFVLVLVDFLTCDGCKSAKNSRRKCTQEGECIEIDITLVRSSGRAATTR